MSKKCIICGKPAKYVIKGTSEYYCEECAEENFADISMLEKVDDRKRDEVFDDVLNKEADEEDMEDREDEDDSDEDDDDKKLEEE